MGDGAMKLKRIGSINPLLRRPSKTPQHPVNSQFAGLSFTAITSFFYINQPAQTADLSSM